MSKKSRIENLKILEEEFVANDSSDSEQEVDDFIGQIVNLQFEGFTAEEDDFNGIQRLLTQSFRGLDVNLSNMADLIIAQNYVGCVIKEVIDDEKQAMEVDDDALEGSPDTESDYVFGLNTIVNITQPKRSQASYISTLREALLKRCEKSSCSDSTKQLFQSVLTNKEQHVGLLINERLVNLPPQLSMPAFKTLLTEVEEANKIQMPFQFKYVMLISKLYKITKLKGKKKKDKHQTSAGASNARSSDAETSTKEVFANVEEEILAKFAEASFEYCVEDCSTLSAESWNESESTQKRVKPYRRVLLVPADKLETALQEADTAVADMA